MARASRARRSLTGCEKPVTRWCSSRRRPSFARRLRHRLRVGRLRHRRKDGPDPRLRELGYQVRELRFVDREGRTSASLSVAALARLTLARGITPRRSDLATTI